MRSACQTDLSDAEWVRLRLYLPPSGRSLAGSPLARDPRRRLLHPQERLLRLAAAPGGCRRTAALRRDVGEDAHHAAREVRIRLGRAPRAPAAASWTARASRPPGWRGGPRRYDAGKKKVKDRLRPLLVDTERGAGAKLAAVHADGTLDIMEGPRTRREVLCRGTNQTCHPCGGIA